MQKKERIVTKFFVANIPDKCSVDNLKSFLGDYGDIEKVYVARKLNKFGQRFAFVNFLDVQNVQDLENKMKNVKIGENKIFITVAKFVDGNFVGHNIQSEKMKRKIKKDVDVDGNEEVYRPMDTQFKDKLMNKETQETQKGQIVIDVAPNVCAFSDWFDVAIIAKAKELTDLINLRKNLVGADLKEANRFMVDKEVWGRWFHKIQIWKGQDLPYERVAWLKVLGVPLNLSMMPVFNAVGSRFGKVVQSADVTDDDSDLSFAYVGVLCKMPKKINETVFLRWQNRMLQVWVEEEQRNWVPDCLLSKTDDEKFEKIS
ncbi:putative RNA recognition motif domain, nucleotide-binding alpha-beta plait domain superfamily [Helianthus annuus]|nr:putative RNA recognition motif domain, nucleotide-binding alpha-beta plait domain superfamily [Helianthus annuus]KAJ0810495.1 putative RNA recognition motif domain, nucleotide-binding alpha-beta plait domain superfamily [Helianthus annuus]